MNDRTMSLVLTSELDDRITKVSQQKGLSKASLIRLAVSEYLEG